MIFQQIYTVKSFQEPSDNSFIKKLNPWKNFAALILKWFQRRKQKVSLSKKL